MNESLRSLKILVVENHADTLFYLTRYLEQRGHTVRAAENMHSALAKLTTEPAEVLISDIGLPDGDGWELLRNGEAHKPHFAIAMSGYATHADREKSRAAGFHHHLVKPFDLDELNSILSEAELHCQRLAACEVPV